MINFYSICLNPLPLLPSFDFRVVTMALLGEPEKTNGLLGVVLAKDSGQIDVQCVKKKWALPQPEESEKLNLILLQSF